eukprot:gene17828-17670_t
MSGQRLIVVEDEAPLRELYARALEQAGYQVRTAGGAQACRHLLREGPRRKLALGPFRMDLEAHALSAAGVDIPLTRGEFAILALLVAAGGKVVAREALFERISRKPDE